MLLLLSGDNNLNPGPVTRHELSNPKFEAFNIKGLHLIHPKFSNAGVIEITETKSDNTIYDSKVTIDGYSIVRNDRNRKDGGVACYIRSNIFYSRKTCLSDNLENIIIDLLFPKTKPIYVRIFYKPPTQTRYLVQIITEFQSLKLNNEFILLETLT